MDVENLISPISDYLTFFLEFWLYCDGCLQPYSHLEHISPEALLLSLLGTAFYLIIRYADVGIIDPDPNPDHSRNPKNSTNSTLLIFFAGLANVVIFEVALWLCGSRTHANFGQIHSTINASLLWGAAIQPISAAQSRLSFISTKINKTKGWAKGPINLLNISFAILTIYLTIKAYFRAFSEIHAVPYNDLWFPSVAALSIIAALSVVFCRALWQWIRFVRG